MRVASSARPAAVGLWTTVAVAAAAVGAVYAVNALTVPFVTISGVATGGRQELVLVDSWVVQLAGTADRVVALALIAAIALALRSLARREPPPFQRWWLASGPETWLIAGLVAALGVVPPVLDHLVAARLVPAIGRPTAGWLLAGVHTDLVVAAAVYAVAAWLHQARAARRWAGRQLAGARPDPR